MKKLKPWPKPNSDAEAEKFVAEADLSEYNWTAMKSVRYEFEDKGARVNMRMPESQLMAIKEEAEKRGMKYQRFMRELLERGMQSLR